MKKLLLEITLAFILIPLGCQPSTNRKKDDNSSGLKAKQINENFRFEESGSVKAFDWSTPCVSINGEIYFSYITPDQYAAIAKQDKNGNVSITKIFHDVHEDGHHKASLGIDKNGYIHYAADMHSHTHVRPANEDTNVRDNSIYFWQYWISDKPYDISSFSFYGDDPNRVIPGEYVTYPRFVRDKKDDLYVTFRCRVSDKYEPGTFSAAIAKYDPKMKKWNMLGGTDYTHGEKTMIWHEVGRGGNTAYQSYNVGIHFDRNNTMHIAWTVYTTESGSQKGGYDASHLMYAKSTNGGITWSKANGSEITKLPITIDHGDVVKKIVPGDFRGGAYVVVDQDLNPVITTSRKFPPEGFTKPFITRWNGQSWDEIEPFMYDNNRVDENILSDQKGIITGFVYNNPNVMIRSDDAGVTWSPITLDSDGNRFAPDHFYMLKTGNLRYGLSHDSLRVIYTAHF